MKLLGTVLFFVGLLMVFGTAGTEDLRLEMMQAGMTPVPILSFERFMFWMIAGTLLLLFGLLMMIFKKNR